MSISIFLRRHFITALLILALPAAVQAQFTFTTNNGSVTITGYTGPGGAVVIPSTTNGYTVTGIGPSAFSYCSSLTSVTIPDSVNSIGQQAFLSCESLSSITIPDGVTSIGAYTFESCENLTNIVIPNSVTNIGGWAFDWCVSLTNITIPSSVTTIGEGPFAGCTSLTNISVDSDNPSYSSLDGVLFDKAQGTLVACPAGPSSGIYAIPNGVTNIGEEAFMNCSRMTSVIIPSSVTTIEVAAFYVCTSLTNIVIPNGLTSIGDEAFAYCTSLPSVTVPSSVTSIEGQAFYQCANLRSAYFEGNAPPDNGNTFLDDPLTVYYPSGTTGWGATFGGAPAVEETAINEFSWVTNSDAVSVTITAYTGSGGSVVIPNPINGYSVTSIGPSAFSYCTSLTSLIIPDSVTSIGQQAFYGCDGLDSIVIPEGVTNIGPEAFAFCTNLASAFFEGNPPSNNGTAFYGDPETIVNYAPETIGWGTTFGGAPAAWITPPSDFSYETNGASITITGYNGPGGPVRIPGYINGYPVTIIGENAFGNRTGLTSATIPSGVTTIEYAAFFGCSALTNIVIPGSVTNIGTEALSFCTSLTSVTIPGSVTSIGDWAFYESTSLAFAYFEGNAPPDDKDNFLDDLLAVAYYPSGTTGWGATFGGAPTVEETATNEFGWVTNSDAVSITITAYAGSDGSVVIPNPINGYYVTSIGPSAFINCASLTSITIPNCVTSIGQQAFFGCDDLISVVITGEVTNVGPEAFAFCANLTEASFAGNAPPDNGTAFYGDPEAIVEYAAGTVGWGTTFGGAPTTEPSEFHYETNDDSITITGYKGPGGAVLIPSYINGYAVTSIGLDAFSQSTGATSITNLMIPSTVTSIGVSAFQNCTSLPSVTIPNSVTNIGSRAFENCVSLTNIVIPDSVTSIGGYAFAYCATLTSIAVPDSVTNIGVGSPFASCLGLTNISVNAANPSYSSLNGVLFDKTLDALIAYPAGLTNDAYTIPNSVTSIGESAFQGCNHLASIGIPSGVTNIGETAFFPCANLTSIVIPNSVTSIGEWAFGECLSLRSAYFLGNAPEASSQIFIYAQYHDPAIVYYLPGTTGWGATFGGVPTELWNPQATAFTTTGGQFTFNITGPKNANIVVETCTNLTNPVWLPVSTNTLSTNGTSSFNDPQWTNYPNRYYRFSAP